MSETHHTFCRICESLCGLEVRVEEGPRLEVSADRAQVEQMLINLVKNGAEAEGCQNHPHEHTTDAQGVL